MKSQKAKELIEKYAVGNSRDAAPSMMKGRAVECVEITEQEAEERMRKELTRWNDPNKPPTDEMRVIAKVVLPNGATLVTGAWYAVNEFPTGWSVDLDRTFENLHVLGWRPIYENE